MTALIAFNYDALEPDLADDARRIATRIKNRLSEGYLATGRDLLEIKFRLGHGRFGAWLDLEFAMSRRSAERYIAAAKLHQVECDIVSHLPAGTMYALSAPSLPDPVRVDCLNRLRQGAQLTRTDVADKACDFRIRLRMETREAEVAKRPRGKKARVDADAAREAEHNEQERKAAIAYDELIAIIVDATRNQHALVHRLMVRLKKLGCVADLTGDLFDAITASMTGGVAE